MTGVIVVSVVMTLLVAATAGSYIRLRRREKARARYHSARARKWRADAEERKALRTIDTANEFAFETAVNEELRRREIAALEEIWARGVYKGPET